MTTTPLRRVRPGSEGKGKTTPPETVVLVRQRRKPEENGPVLKREKKRPQKEMPDPTGPDPILEGLLADITFLKVQKKEFEASYDAEYYPKEAQAIERMRSRGITFYKGETAAGTLVEPMTPEVDEVALEEALPPELWEKVTTRVVDRKKLEAAIRLGVIPGKTVAQVTTMKASKPYIAPPRGGTSAGRP